MKIAIATKNWETVSGHAGKARCWLIYDLQPGKAGAPLPPPARIELTNDQVLHYFHDDGPHRWTAWKSWWRAVQATVLSGT